MRSARDRTRKYLAKYNPEITRQRLHACKEDVKRDYFKAVRRVKMAEDVVSEALDDRAISGGIRTTYHAFARKLQKRLYRTSLIFWEKLTKGCIEDFVISYGLDREILERIAEGVQDVIRLVLTVEGRVRLSEKELELVKERGRRFFESYPDLVEKFGKK